MIQTQEIMKQCISYSKYFNDLPDREKSIPGMKSFIKLLCKDFQEGHLLHAKLISKFLPSQKFKITQINKQIIDKKKDIDIELNQNINIQVWYGQNLSQQLDNCLSSAQEKKVQINDKIIKIKVFSGGIKTIRENDSDLGKKINQLPDKNLGLVICHNLAMPISSEWTEQLPKNKAIVDILNTAFGKDFSKIYGQSHIYCSNNFKFSKLTKEILSDIGFPITNIH